MDATAGDGPFLQNKHLTAGYQDGQLAIALSSQDDVGQSQVQSRVSDCLVLLARPHEE